jgi:polar amino acid transport system substrate-binding protein
MNDDVVHDLAPTGRLRVSINLGNSVLAQTDAATGAPKGISVALARHLGEDLNVPVDLVAFTAAGAVFEAIVRKELDIVFLAIDPLRAEEIEFTPPYALIEGTFVVKEASQFNSLADIDRPGVCITVARNSAYDLFLTRALKAATLIRPTTGEQALNMFMTEGHEAAAGVKQPILTFMTSHSGLRLIDPSFMEIRQAMGTPKGRAVGAAYLRSFIERAKTSGFVADYLRNNGQDDVVVAPPA